MSDDYSTVGMTHDERVAFLTEHNSDVTGAHESLRLTSRMVECYATSIAKMTAALANVTNPVQLGVERRHLDRVKDEHADLVANVKALTTIVESLPPCGAVHPLALHTDESDIACTLPTGHPGGEHEDHSHRDITGEVMLWCVGDNVHRAGTLS
jgi:hypothetical protein